VSRIQRFRPTRAAVVTGAVIGAISLAGCGAGQITQTDTQLPAVQGATGNVGAVAVRGAQIAFSDEAKGANIYPVGAAAPLVMTIVNSGGQPDRLVSASSPAAASVEISGTADIPAGRALVVAGEPAAAPAAPTASASGTASVTPSGSAAASGSAEPTPSAVASPPPEPGTPGDEIGGAGQETGVPAVAPTADLDGPAEAPSGAAQVVLSGLKEDIRAGLTYPLVLNFQVAGQVTLNVPVGYPDKPREDAPAE
jgi:copper(I)-binding protein